MKKYSSTSQIKRNLAYYKMIKNKPLPNSSSFFDNSNSGSSSSNNNVFSSSNNLLRADPFHIYYFQTTITIGHKKDDYIKKWLSNVRDEESIGKLNLAVNDFFSKIPKVDIDFIDDDGDIIKIPIIINFWSLKKDEFSIFVNLKFHTLGDKFLYKNKVDPEYFLFLKGEIQGETRLRDNSLNSDVLEDHIITDCEFTSLWYWNSNDNKEIELFTL